MRISTVLSSAKPTFLSHTQRKVRALRVPHTPLLHMLERRRGRCLGRVHSSWFGRLTRYLLSSGKSDLSHLHSLLIIVQNGVDVQS